jgi:hypothetical protein
MRASIQREIKMATAKKPTRSKTQLNQQLNEIKNHIANQDDVDPTTAVAASRRKTEVMESVKGVTVAGVVSSISTLGLESQAALDQLKNMMVASAIRLRELEDAITLTTAELNDLHDKEIVSSSLTDLLVEYDAKKKQLEEEAAAAQAAAAQAQFDNMRKESERKREVEQARKREEEEYAYNRTVFRRQEEDAFSQIMLSKRREFTDYLDKLEKSWKDREVMLSTKESEFDAYKTQVEAFPAVLETEKKKAVESIIRAVTSDHKHAVDMLNAKSASDAALAAAEIKSLKDKLAGSDSLIASLQAKLEAAEKRVESIANSALQSASGRQALEAASSMAATLKSDGSRKS